jgi:hypothetical protein
MLASFLEGHSHLKTLFIRASRVVLPTDPQDLADFNRAWDHMCANWKGPKGYWADRVKASHEIHKKEVANCKSQVWLLVVSKRLRARFSHLESVSLHFTACYEYTHDSIGRALKSYK